MSTLTLLGTVHRDPQGLTRLVEGLARLKPHVITLEFSVYGLTYRQRKKKILTKKLLQGLREIRKTETLKIHELKNLLRSTGIRGVAALLDLPFEYKGASFYSQRHGLPLYCLDISSLSRQLLSHIDELLAPRNLQKVLAFETTPLQKAVTREYRHAEHYVFDSQGKQSPWAQRIPTEDWKTRERIMANRIRKIVTMHQGCHTIHIGGWQHLVPRQGTLLNLLDDLKPQRILLGSRSLTL